MFFNTLALSAAMALTATAIPLEHTHLHAHNHLSTRQSATTFPLHIINQCSTTKNFGIYQITPEFTVNQVGASQTIDAGQSATIQAPFQETGLRLSANADWPIGNQLAMPQALFEFGYAAGWSGSPDGTAYDISIMPGSDSAIGIHASVIPNGSGSTSCESKTCLPWNCPLSQGWTNEDQTSNGSPADTVCYAGPSAMTVVWCPSAQGSS